MFDNKVWFVDGASCESLIKIAWLGRYFDWLSSTNSTRGSLQATRVFAQLTAS